MKILLVYGTTDGQTRKIARFAADRLADAGHAAELLQAADAPDTRIDRFDGVILAGSLHIGGFQKDLVAFAMSAADDLNKAQTLFLPVSLSAAGDNMDDWAGLNRAVAEFREVTGWTPGQITHVAGAFRFTEYDFFRAWAMRWIATRRDQSVDTKQGKEYTDWEALGATLDTWVAGLKKD